MSVGHSLTELGGNVSGSVMCEDTVERNDIMILNCFFYPDPSQFLIKRI